MPLGLVSGEAGRGIDGSSPFKASIVSELIRIKEGLAGTP